MPLRNFIVLLILAISLPGCHMWGWSKSTAKPAGQIVENFSETQPQKEKENESDDDNLTTSGTFARQNERSEDPGTGLSNRSREIERNLGYR